MLGRDRVASHRPALRSLYLRLRRNLHIRTVSWSVTPPALLANQGTAWYTWLMRAILPRLLALLAVVAFPACDTVVGPGQTVTLSGQGLFFGSGGNVMTPSLPAVRVQPSGVLFIEDAELFGGGTIVESPQQTPLASAGIASDGGGVAVRRGTVRGGPVVIQVPTSGRALAGAGVDASQSVVLVEGGTLIGGDIVVQESGSGGGFAGPGLQARESDVLVTGGSFKPGNPSRDARGVPTDSFVADFSAVEIDGGDFAGQASFFNSNVLIQGGRFDAIRFVISGAFQTTPFCSEIRGGSISSIEVADFGTLFVFGTDFNLPFGEVSLAVLRRITGTLENGTPIDTPVSVPISGQRRSRFVLVPPGGQGCGF